MNRRGVYLFAAARLAWGVALLSKPATILGATGGGVTTGAIATARVLGVRHVAQALVTFASPTPATLALGAATDVLHAASMVPLAAAVRRERNAAAADGLLAGTMAVVGRRLSKT